MVRWDIEQLFAQIQEKKKRIFKFKLVASVLSIIFSLVLMAPGFSRLPQEIGSLIFFLVLGIILYISVISIVLTVLSVIIDIIYLFYPPIKELFDTSETTNFEEIVSSLVLTIKCLEENRSAATLNREHNKQMAILYLKNAISRVDKLIKSQLRSEYLEPIKDSLIKFKTQLKIAITIIDKNSDSTTSIQAFLAKSTETFIDREYQFDYTALAQFKNRTVPKDIVKQIIDEINQILNSLLTVKTAVRFSFALIIASVITLPIYYYINSAKIDFTLAGLFITILSIPLSIALSILFNKTSSE